jgi:hypothetical protein
MLVFQGPTAVRKQGDGADFTAVSDRIHKRSSGNYADDRLTRANIAFSPSPSRCRRVRLSQWLYSCPPLPRELSHERNGRDLNWP